MKYKTKLKLKLSSYWVLSLLELLLILGIGYLCDRFLELLFTVIGFFTLRPTYEKQYHASTLSRCSIISLIVMCTVVFIEIPKTISVLCALLLSLSLTYMSYHLRDYLDLLDRYKAQQVKITKGISEKDLYAIIEYTDLTEVQKNILVMYYSKRYSITKISKTLNYSYDYIVELKQKALKELTK